MMGEAKVGASRSTSVNTTARHHSPSRERPYHTHHIILPYAAHTTTAMGGDMNISILTTLKYQWSSLIWFPCLFPQDSRINTIEHS
jgi:hypothetical protein